MRPPRALVFAASAAVILASVLVAPVIATAPASASPTSASPFAARALAPTNTLLGLSCDWNRGSDRLELSVLDPATGVGTRIGEADTGEIYFCAFSLAWDNSAASCTAYTVARGPDDPTALLRTDLSTGMSTLVAPITLDGVRVWASSLAIDNAGFGWVLYDNRLHRIDLATGVLTPVVAISGAGVGTLAINPLDGGFFGTDGRVIYRLDPTTGVATPILTPDLSRGGGSPHIEGMAFDEDGTLWITALTFDSLGLEIFEAEHELWSTTLPGTPEFAGLISSATEGVTIATLALAVVPEGACDLPTLALPGTPTPASAPTLAATGVEDASPVLVPVALVALGLGALLLSFARRARRAGAHRRG